MEQNPGLTDNAVQCLNAIKKNLDDLNSDVCTQTARNLFEFMGTGKVFEDVGRKELQDGTFLTKARDGVYRVTLSMGDGQVWQHGFVLYKKGADVMLLQSWVNKFSLEEWLSAEDHKDRIADACSGFFAPTGESYRSGSMKSWFTMFSTLDKAFKADFAKFSGACQLLFGVDQSVKVGKGINVNEMAWRNYSQGNLNVATEFRDLKDANQFRFKG